MAEDDWTERLPEAAREYLEGHRLDEVECVIADLPGGKGMQMRFVSGADYQP